jgi:hypothetical protein
MREQTKGDPLVGAYVGWMFIDGQAMARLEYEPIHNPQEAAALNLKVRLFGRACVSAPSLAVQTAFLVGAGPLPG